MIEVKTYGLTDVGRKRKKNEDQFVLNDQLGLYVVADGMGGHKGGAVASQLAVDTIHSVIQSFSDDPANIKEADVRPGDYKGWIVHAVQSASKAVHDKSKENKALKGMGTTVVMVLVHDDRLYVGNVGDSRCYLIRNNKISQITEDHSLVGEQVKAGLITEDDARNHQYKNVITRSVGFQPTVEVDVCSKQIKYNDAILLCSDGLSNMLDDNQLLTMILANSAKSICQKLVDMANEKGGDDNITTIYLNFEEGHCPDEPTIEL
jgi:serine/threonine protein phosphatase PrpC